MKTRLLVLSFAALSIGGCKKAANNNNAAAVTSSEVVNDFVQKIVLPQYQSLQDKATLLNNAVAALNATPNAANLNAAQQAWRDTRSAWEQCEGFLVGPVEDDNYDPNMDTWPVDYLQLDSLISSNITLNTTTVQSLGQSLRGFHPLEFILWGQSGNATVDSINAKQKQYMVGLAQDILNTVTALNTSWRVSGGNFQAVVLTAGTGSTRYATRKDAMLAMAGGMADICDEVGGGKIAEPFATRDSLKTESPFSHNSMLDFINNIKGAQNVYLCSFDGSTGASLSSYVNANNLSLDNKIKTQFDAAIAALNSISGTFETAIFSERTQLQNAMDAINKLHATLDSDLKTYIQTYVKD